jgi:hypothetical protein
MHDIKMYIGDKLIGELQSMECSEVQSCMTCGYPIRTKVWQGAGKHARLRLTYCKCCWSAPKSTTPLMKPKLPIQVESSRIVYKSRSVGMTEILFPDNTSLI